MKKLLFILLAISTFANAQNDTIWMSKFNSMTTKHSAEYFRIIKKINEKSFLINDYRLNKTKILEQTCNINEDKTFDGKDTNFFEDGKTVSIFEIKNSYINGRAISFLKSGSKTECIYKNNIPFEGSITFQEKGYCVQHIAKNGLPLSDKYYNDDNENSGYVDTFLNGIKTRKSFDKNGIIIGEAIYDKENNVVSGIEGQYSFEAPLVLHKLIHYKNKKIVKEVFLLNNGNKREIKTYNINKTETTETFDNNSVKVGTLTEKDGIPILQGKRYSYYDPLFKEIPESLITYKQGKFFEEIVYDKKAVIKIKIDYNEQGYFKNKTHYDKNGKIIGKLSQFGEGGINGLDIHGNHFVEYKNGKKISDKEFYNSGELLSSEINNIITYLDKKDQKIGEIDGNFKRDGEFYNSPYEGIVYSYSDNNDCLSGYRKYKKGVLVEGVNYFYESCNYIIENQKFYSDKQEAYNTYYGAPIKQIKYFKNGMKKIEFLDYIGNEEFGKIIYYDPTGKKIGEYDKNKNEGTKCFYYDQESEDLESIETYKNGKLQNEKKFHQTKNFFGNIVTKIELFEEIDHSK